MATIGIDNQVGLGAATFSSTTPHWLMDGIATYSPSLAENVIEVGIQKRTIDSVDVEIGVYRTDTKAKIGSANITDSSSSTRVVATVNWALIANVTYAMAVRFINSSTVQINYSGGASHASLLAGTSALANPFVSNAVEDTKIAIFATTTAGSSTTLDSINSGTVLSGSTGNTANTTGLGALASLTIGGKAATNLIALTANSTSFSFPLPAAGQLYPDWGTQTAIATDFVPASGSLSVILGLPSGYQSVTISSVVTSQYYVGYYLPLSIGDKVISKTPALLGISSANSVSASGEILSDYNGTQTMFVRQATTGYIWELTVTTPSMAVVVSGKIWLGFGLGI